MKKRVGISILILSLFMLFTSHFCEIYQANTLTSIMGEGVLSAEQMYMALIERNKENGLNPIDEDYAMEFVIATINEAEKEGVRSDVAFALMMKETGYLNFGGDVVPTQNNFGGIGTTGSGVKGEEFADVSVGVRAVVQHLKCYATTDELEGECVDPRFIEYIRGKAPYVEQLGKEDNPNGVGWAVPGSGYGRDIVAMIDQMKKLDTSKIKKIDTTKEQTTREQKEVSTNLPSLLIIAILVILLLKLLLSMLAPPKKSTPSTKNTRTKTPPNQSGKAYERYNLSKRKRM